MNGFENQAAWMTAIKKIELGPADTCRPGRGEVLIRTEYVGICGSDVHFFESGERKGKRFALPFILGHECSGVIVEIGEGVETLAVGNRVTIEPQQTCGVCEFCKGGRYNLCTQVAFPSVPPYDGVLRRYFTFPAHLCFQIPPEISSLCAALVEPMAVGFQAAWQGEVEVGKTVVILGMGCIGLTSLIACKARGASRIIAVDLYEKRLEAARQLGADICINSAEEDMRQRVMELTDGGGDIVLETAGSTVTAAETGFLLRRGGVIVMVGNVQKETPYDFMNLMYKEGQIRTIYRYKNNFQTTIDTMRRQSIPLEKMVSHVFPFENTQQAFACSSRDKANVIKAVVKVG